MLKLMVCFKRRFGMALADFHQHWRTRHAELVAGLPGLERYVQNVTGEGAYRRSEPIYDGVAELWFADRDRLAQCLASRELGRVRADDESFVAPESRSTLLAREEVVVDGDASTSGAKFFAFLRRRQDLSPADFQRYWRGVHGPIAGRIPGNQRYVQCHAVLEQGSGGDGGAARPWDGIAVTWFRDLDALRSSGDTPEYRATRTDEANFLSGERIPFVIVHEREIALH